ncbi:MAG TPA: hypothetical protein VG676_08640 [Chitinophagaceae bacterium]|jgi:hypothetical protein|nr:hypothetical protein [Chitinophagaceae bacterium]
MEVHKHPHHEEHQKNWRSYLLEFFMLFLAVFLGFIAENIRERIVENKRGEEYIHSFTEDLKKDTAQFRGLISFLTIQDSMTNNMKSCYDSITHSVTSTACLTNILKNLAGFPDFVYTDRTIQQLKNAGGLRLITNKAVADSIIIYDGMVRRQLIHQDALEGLQQKSIDAIKSMIDFHSFNAIYMGEPRSFVLPEMNDIHLLQTGKEAIDNFFNTLLVFKANLKSQLNWMKQLKKMATGLILYLSDK